MFVPYFKILQQRYWQKVFLVLGGLVSAYLFYPLVFNLEAVYLTTDVLIYFLVFLSVLFIAYIRQQPHLAVPWKQVFKNKIAMGSSVVLLFFIIVGLLDSIHFRYSVQPERSADSYSVNMVSLLDVGLEYISKDTEKTYSSPFSVYSYSKENFINEKGIKYRAYPRLKIAGSHLNDPAKEYWSDIVRKSLKGLAIGLFIAVGVTVIFVFYLSKFRARFFVDTLYKLAQDKLGLPWRVMLLTLTVVILFFSWLFYMSAFYHVMGTDKVGQDVFYLTLKSIRTGLVIGTLTTLIMLPFAIALGVMAGYFKGLVDDVIQYIYTTLNSIPGILLIVAVMLAIDVYIENHPDLFETAIERADIKLLALCLVLGITSWTGLCRLLRGEVFKLRELEYIQAARSLGVSNFKIITSHIIPNVMHIVLIVVVLDFSGLVLAEAVLAYIGVGVDPSTISWGNMINSARLELARDPVVWWSLISAFSFMFALVLAANLFSDAIRDAFDPRQQGVK
ncbi:ABC transporter, permease protein 2 (cluster 5, nickel/peptides/opines) [hydrothermal vent metagenome]|uniref:ABC transporter, permease protein 2 (Cluster 5, nickel/peptides/opines) n=1 Tax=hydrothermal vent metagenome TaxID=652676 RepID=A0A3B0ZQH5_9ZZZZ